MKGRAFLLSMMGIMIGVSGCASPTERKAEGLFAGEEIPAIRTVSEFDQVLSEVPSNRGKQVRLAGRVLRVEDTDEGYRGFVRWLPFPPAQRLDQGPREGMEGEENYPRYVVTFRGKVKDRAGIVLGNHFIVEGTVDGTRNMVVDVFGQSRDLLLVKARCVRVWETGASENASSDSQIPKAVSRTYCATE